MSQDLTFHSISADVLANVGIPNADFWTLGLSDHRIRKLNECTSGLHMSA